MGKIEKERINKKNDKINFKKLYKKLNEKSNIDNEEY